MNIVNFIKNILSSNNNSKLEHITNLENFQNQKNSNGPKVVTNLLGFSKEQEEKNKSDTKIVYPVAEYDICVKTVIPEDDLIQMLKDKNLVFISEEEYLISTLKKIMNR